jgi:hypothetical protein
MPRSDRLSASSRRFRFRHSTCHSLAWQHTRHAAHLLNCASELMSYRILDMQNTSSQVLCGSSLDLSLDTPR